MTEDRDELRRCQTARRNSRSRPSVLVADWSPSILMVATLPVCYGSRQVTGPSDRRSAPGARSGDHTDSGRRVRPTVSSVGLVGGVAASGILTV
jgi:hypothetical protein